MRILWKTLSETGDYTAKHCRYSWQWSMQGYILDGALIDNCICSMPLLVLGETYRSHLQFNLFLIFNMHLQLFALSFQSGDCSAEGTRYWIHRNTTIPCTRSMFCGTRCGVDGNHGVQDFLRGLCKVGLPAKAVSKQGAFHSGELQTAIFCAQQDQPQVLRWQRWCK